jgi:hypothetical protein
VAVRTVIKLPVDSTAPAKSDAFHQAEAALKALPMMRDEASLRRAVDALDRALLQLRERLRQPGDTAPRPENVPQKKGY